MWWVISWKYKNLNVFFLYHQQFYNKTKLFDDYVNVLTENVFYVKINDIKSVSKSVVAGALQGNILGAHTLFYNIYISNLPVIKTVHVSAYADDTTLLVESYRVDTICNRLSTAINKISKFGCFKNEFICLTLSHGYLKMVRN